MKSHFKIKNRLCFQFVKIKSKFVNFTPFKFLFDFNRFLLKSMKTTTFLRLKRNF